MTLQTVAPLSLSMNKLSLLFEMLKYRRPGGELTDEEFIQKFIVPTGAERDGYGNFILKIGDAPILWSCHTDTVHKDNGYQKITTDGKKIYLPKGSDSNCLGADDTAGCWMLLQMIAAKREGLYIFHRDEEIGSRGSSWIRANTPEILQDIQYAIAFDRRGFKSVITHQLSQRCASDEFAKSAAAMLPEGFVADDTGLYTDTAKYADIIPECSNFSVGFSNEHSISEELDISHVIRLRDKMVKFDHTKLHCVRDPAKKEWKRYYYSTWEGWENDGEGLAYGSYNRYFKRQTQQSTVSSSDLDLVSLIESYPHEAADYLESLGVDRKSFLEYLHTAFIFPN